MKKPLKKSILFLFLGVLLLSSYSYVFHAEYLANSVSTTQIQEQLKESSYHLPDIEIVKHILNFLTNLTP